MLSLFELKGGKKKSKTRNKKSVRKPRKYKTRRSKKSVRKSRKSSCNKKSRKSCKRASRKCSWNKNKKGSRKHKPYCSKKRSGKKKSKRKSKRKLHKGGANSTRASIGQRNLEQRPVTAQTRIRSSAVQAARKSLEDLRKEREASKRRQRFLLIAATIAANLYNNNYFLEDIDDLMNETEKCHVYKVINKMDEMRHNESIRRNEQNRIKQQMKSTSNRTSNHR